MRFRAQVIETFKGLWHEPYREIVLKLLRHMHQFLLGELLWAFKGKSPPPHNQASYAFNLLLVCLDQFWQANPSLGIEELSEELLLHRLPNDVRTLSEVCIPCNAAPPNDCTKSFNNSSSRTVGRPFMMGHPDTE